MCMNRVIGFAFEYFPQSSSPSRMSHHCQYRWSSRPSALPLNKRESLAEYPAAPLLLWQEIELHCIALCCPLTWFCEPGVRWEDASGGALCSEHWALRWALSTMQWALNIMHWELSTMHRVLFFSVNWTTALIIIQTVVCSEQDQKYVALQQTHQNSGDLHLYACQGEQLCDHKGVTTTSELELESLKV